MFGSVTLEGSGIKERHVKAGIDRNVMLFKQLFAKLILKQLNIAI